MQRVLITGASRGLGRALALGFAAKGWTVSACATDPEAIRSLASELGAEHLAVTCDRPCWRCATSWG
jgi:NAD(P)-dependent dehydrogenase (short-subunit alcohol dehydrogenase family)